MVRYNRFDGGGSARAERPKFLIVTADDFGQHEAVNEGILRANRAGVLTAASLMTAAPAAADALRVARGLPNLRVGLHLVLADGWSTLPPPEIPALAGADGYMSGEMIRKSVRVFASRLVRRQLEAEIRAQFVAFRATGLVLDHLNAHKHFHLHPTVLDALLRIGADFGLSAVRLPKEPLWFAATSPNRISTAAGAVLLRPWLAWMRQRLRSAGVAYNDHIVGVAGSGAMDESTLLQALARLAPGITEIYLHPATISGVAIAPAMGNYRHADELAALLSPRVRAAIAAAGVGCGGFRDLPRSAARGAA